MTWLHVLLIGGCAASTVFIGRWIKRICEYRRDVNRRLFEDDGK